MASGHWPPDAGRARLAAVFQSPRSDPILALLAGLSVALFLRREPEPPIPKDPRRIVVNAPDLVEILFALREEPRIVGVTEAAKHPKAARLLKRIGSYEKTDPEALLLVRPDLFLTLSSDAPGQELARSLRIPVLAVRNERLSDIDRAMHSIALAVGAPSRGEALARSIREKIEAVRARTRGRKAPRTLLVLERRPGTLEGISAVGSDNFMDELITAAGGANATGPRLLRYPRLSVEDLLLADPEVILDFSVHGFGAAEDRDPLGPYRREVPGISAVRNDRVVILPEGFDLIPGPRLPEILGQLARLIHPEAFPR